MRMMFNCELTVEVPDNMEDTEEETKQTDEEENSLIDTNEAYKAKIETHPENKTEMCSVMFKNGDDTR